MTDYFLDSSALVKRYFLETGSQWVLAITDTAAGHSILLAEISLAEVAAAAAAKHRAPLGISLQVRDRTVGRFLQECAQQFVLLRVDRPVIDVAVKLTQTYRLRGYDAVQLATALVNNQNLIAAGRPGLTFVSADADLLLAAQAEGLATENPLTYTSPDATL